MYKSISCQHNITVSNIVKLARKQHMRDKCGYQHVCLCLPDEEDSDGCSVDQEILHLARSINQTVSQSVQSSPNTSGGLLDSQEIATVVKKGVDIGAFNTPQMKISGASNSSLTCSNDGGSSGDDTAYNSEDSDDSGGVCTSDHAKDLSSERNTHFTKVKHKADSGRHNDDISGLSPIVPVSKTETSSPKGRLSSTQKPQAGNTLSSHRGLNCDRTVGTKAFVDSDETEDLSDSSPVPTKVKTTKTSHHVKGNKNLNIVTEETLSENKTKANTLLNTEHQQPVKKAKVSKRRSTRLSLKEVMNEMNQTNIVTHSQVEKADINVADGNEDEDEDPFPSTSQNFELKIKNAKTSSCFENNESKNTNTVNLSKNSVQQDEDYVSANVVEEVISTKSGSLKNSRSKSASDLSQAITTGNTRQSKGRGRKSMAVMTTVVNDDDHVRDKVTRDDNMDRPNSALEGGAKKGKRTVKKKLMSLTDLQEQHSVLLEPTKCSEETRPQLQPSKEKKGRKKKSVEGENLMKTKECGKEDVPKITKKGRGKTNVSDASSRENSVDKAGNVVENEVGTANNKGKRGKRSSSEVQNTTDVTRGSLDVSKPKRGRRKTDVEIANDKGPSDKPTCDKRTSSVRGRKSKQTFVNDTMTEDADIKTSDETTVPQPGPVARIHDITTQLNLTKDNSLVCSIRETTLSMSMSRAYNDTNVSAILNNPRRSVDEFSLSQKQKQAKRPKASKKSVLKTVSETESKSSSESDTSVGGKKSRLNSSGSRKVIRPSIVMTSLHSKYVL